MSALNNPDNIVIERQQYRFQRTNRILILLMLIGAAIVAYGLYSAFTAMPARGQELGDTLISGRVTLEEWQAVVNDKGMTFGQVAENNCIEKGGILKTFRYPHSVRGESPVMHITFMCVRVAPPRGDA